MKYFYIPITTHQDSRAYQTLLFILGYKWRNGEVRVLSYRGICGLSIEVETRRIGYTRRSLASQNVFTTLLPKDFFLKGFKVI